MSGALSESGSRTWIVKVGSSLISDKKGGLRLSSMRSWVAQVAELRGRGIRVVLVSSGAIAVGVDRLGWTTRPITVNRQQAAAAVGQAGLVQSYENCFRRYKLLVAQVLFTHEDIASRQRYLNARNTLRTLLELSTVPLVNENDTVSSEELRLGDNDTLAGLAANLVEAELLVLLTDCAGLHRGDPRLYPEAPLIHEGRAGDPALAAFAGEGGALGRGGMRTKLYAAELAARSGTDTVIAQGTEPKVLSRLVAGEAIGTRLRAGRNPLMARKRWLAGPARPHGGLTVDAGAARHLCEHGHSLLAVGVSAVRGDFQRGAIVAVFSQDGEELARGLVNYDRREVEHIMGQSSDRFTEILGYSGETELIHRDNLVLLPGRQEFPVATRKSKRTRSRKDRVPPVAGNGGGT